MTGSLTDRLTDCAGGCWLRMIKSALGYLLKVARLPKSYDFQQISTHRRRLSAVASEVRPAVSVVDSGQTATFGAVVESVTATMPEWVTMPWFA